MLRPLLPSQPSECQLDTRVNSVTCSWATLEVGAPKLVLINAMANNAGEIVNTAGARSRERCQTPPGHGGAHAGLHAAAS